MIGLLGHEFLEFTPVALLIGAIEFSHLRRAVGGVECIAVRPLRLVEILAPGYVLAPDEVPLIESAMVLGEEAIG
jgi:hypothetical protein